MLSFLHYYQILTFIKSRIKVLSLYYIYITLYYIKMRLVFYAFAYELLLDMIASVLFRFCFILFFPLF